MPRRRTVQKTAGPEKSGKNLIVVLTQDARRSRQHRRDFRHHRTAETRLKVPFELPVLPIPTLPKNLNFLT